MRLMAVVLTLLLFISGCGRQRHYAEGCGALLPNWRTPKQGMSTSSISNVITVGPEGLMAWNGVKITRSSLDIYLGQVLTLNPVPATQVKFSPSVGCDTVKRLRQLVATKLDCKHMICAEGEGRMWIIGDVMTADGLPKPFDPTLLETKPTQ